MVLGFWGFGCQVHLDEAQARLGSDVLGSQRGHLGDEREDGCGGCEGVEERV